MIDELNRHLRGWANYFGAGYPRKAFREINTYVRERLTSHLRQRSQRPFRPPKGRTFHEHYEALGLVYL
jgi:RNA-directed DNA polymerase